MFVSAVTGLFEGVISELAIIVSFQSLILGMSGICAGIMGLYPFIKRMVSI